MTPVLPTSATPSSASPPGDWMLWQLADSAFPIGGFSHSGGIEALWQHQQIRSARDLRAYLQVALTQLSRSILPFVTAAFELENCYPETDQICEAFLTNHVANRASRAQGRAFLRAAQHAFPEKLGGICEAIQSAEQPCHLAPAFGQIAAALGLEKKTAVRLFVFMQLRGWMSAAVRLGILGPLEAQHLQASLASGAEAVVNFGCSHSLEDLAQTAPILDLVQGTQDRLYSRLFQS